MMNSYLWAGLVALAVRHHQVGGDEERVGQLKRQGVKSGAGALSAGTTIGGTV